MVSGQEIKNERQHCRNYILFRFRSSTSAKVRVAVSFSIINKLQANKKHLGVSAAALMLDSRRLLNASSTTGRWLVSQCMALACTRRLMLETNKGLATAQIFLWTTWRLPDFAFRSALFTDQTRYNYNNFEFKLASKTLATGYFIKVEVRNPAVCLLRAIFCD